MQGPKFLLVIGRKIKITEMLICNELFLQLLTSTQIACIPVQAQLTVIRLFGLSKFHAKILVQNSFIQRAGFQYSFKNLALFNNICENSFRASSVHENTLQGRSE